MNDHSLPQQRQHLCFDSAPPRKERIIQRASAFQSPDAVFPDSRPQSIGEHTETATPSSRTPSHLEYAIQDNESH